MTHIRMKGQFIFLSIIALLTLIDATIQQGDAKEDPQNATSTVEKLKGMSFTSPVGPDGSFC